MKWNRADILEELGKYYTIPGENNNADFVLSVCRSNGEEMIKSVAFGIDSLGKNVVINNIDVKLDKMFVLLKEVEDERL